MKRADLLLVAILTLVILLGLGITLPARALYPIPCPPHILETVPDWAWDTSAIYQRCPREQLACLYDEGRSGLGWWLQCQNTLASPLTSPLVSPLLSPVLPGPTPPPKRSTPTLTLPPVSEYMLDTLWMGLCTQWSNGDRVTRILCPPGSGLEHLSTP